MSKILSFRAVDFHPKFGTFHLMSLHDMIDELFIRVFFPRIARTNESVLRVNIFQIHWKWNTKRLTIISEEYNSKQYM
jgi:hypothetical protein